MGKKDKKRKDTHISNVVVSANKIYDYEIVVKESQQSSQTKREDKNNVQNINFI